MAKVIRLYSGICEQGNLTQIAQREDGTWFRRSYEHKTYLGNDKSVKHWSIWWTLLYTPRHPTHSRSVYCLTSDAEIVALAPDEQENYLICGLYNEYLRLQDDTTGIELPDD